jgi:DNA-binding CsgD family transcriptional regulator/tetratricopeptide (TPR) repeat protein
VGNLVEGLTRKGVGWWAGCVAGLELFVGRERELSLLRGALGGETRLLLVVGDAGVGKSRFVREGMRRAASEGLVSVRGDCLPLVAKLPLLPVLEALGELRRFDGGGLLEAALGAASPYVRPELEAVLPQLAGDGGDAGGRESWRRDRLFSAVTELLEVVARSSAVALVIEDVQWADSETLDFLTFVVSRGRAGSVTAVVTCRSDEALLDAHVDRWLAHVRGRVGVEELRVGPLSRDEVAEQIAGLVPGPVPPQVADELYARAAGNPFFTEQLVAAALTESEQGGLRPPAGLPVRLVELLAARVRGCGSDARAVLAALAVAGRALAEEPLCEVTGLCLDAVRAGLRELAAARLLTDTSAGGVPQPRHALLAEAVAAGLLPGERRTLHERMARMLQGKVDALLSAEVAGHWAAAGQPAQELPATVAAAAAAECVFGYAEAAAHWQRAIELFRVLPDASEEAGIDLPRIYLRAIDTLQRSGDGVGAGELAEEAFRRFAGGQDTATTAVMHLRVAVFRGLDSPAAALPLIEKALRLFEQEPPSADQAEAWFRYATIFLFHGQGRIEASGAALNQALAIAEAAGATALIPVIVSNLAVHALLRGQTAEGFAILDRARAMAQASGDGPALVWLAVKESDALLDMGKFERATEVALRGLQAARRTGLDGWFNAASLAATAAKGLLSRGCTAEAAAVVDPLTTGRLDFDHLFVHQARAEIDLLRGDVEAAADRQRQIDTLLGHIASADIARETAQRAMELALWTGRPDHALQRARRALALVKATDLTLLYGRLLAAGMGACADLAEQARALRDGPALDAAQSAAEDLASWVAEAADSPFTEHPHAATNPAHRATWDAERARVRGASDPAAWGAAAKAWQALDCPHRVGYARWRQAEAWLAAGQPRSAAIALRAAAPAARGHAPLAAQIRKLAQRAHLRIQEPPAASADTPRPAEAPAPYGLTGRELQVLRLLAAGRTNAQIGGELYISPKTAGVHVTNILRKLGVSSRVQAAAVAERAGLLSTEPA